MKKILSILLLFSLLIACKEEQKSQEDVEATQETHMAPLNATTGENAVIYEANIRQYSPEGTFEAFTKDIPVLKELGVKIIWVMPINPISEIRRKATGDTFTSEIEDENERKKYLGSYYSVSDYKAVNPEFGTEQDFINLVKTAHDNGIYVVLDWVPNHTGWDHPWITDHPDYYSQNEKGEIIDPVNPDTGESWGWTDTADLNYDNMEMRKEMINDMKYWVETADIDGFRMDVAHQVPVEFFNNAIAEMNTLKPMFMLAEAEKHDLLKGANAFDMQYGWELHHILNQIAKGEKTVKAFDEYLVKIDTVLEADDINMNFVTNHDENSWAGTLQERMPNNKEVFTALIYAMPGMPLIYSGQEYGLAHRLKFFEKDSIPKTKGPYFDLLKKFGELKNTNAALNGGKDAAAYNRLETNDNTKILAFERSKDGKKLIFLANLSSEPIEAKISASGTFTDYLSNEEVTLSSDEVIDLEPWQYHILIAE